MPKNDETRAKKWVINCRREELLEKVVKKDFKYLHENIMFCSLHFEPEMFLNPKKNSLVWNAVPTQFSVPNPPPMEKSSRKPPMKRFLPPPDESAKIRKTLQYIEEEKKNLALCKIDRKKMIQSLKTSQIDRMRKNLKAKHDALRYLRRKTLNPKSMNSKEKKDLVLEVVRPLLTKAELTILKERLTTENKKSRGYSETFKKLAISISFKGGSAYKFLSKKLQLPKKSTISRWLSEVQLIDGYDDDLFKLLEEKIQSLPDADKVASLVVDEMSLKQLMEYDQKRDKIIGVQKIKGCYQYPANVLGIMVRGVRSKWKQLVGFHFTVNALPAEKMHTILREALSRLQKAGLHIVNVTSDQGSNFSSLLGFLNVREEQPYFWHQKQKIFVTPDPPHLIKSARNALLDHDIETPDGKACWSHIVDLYNYEKGLPIKMAPRLSLQHVEPPPLYGKMSVSKATQVLSNTVACALETYIATGVFDKSYLPTAKYCTMMDKIFDTLNSSRKHACTSYKSGLSFENEVSMQFMTQAVSWLKKIRILDSKGEVMNSRFRFLNGLTLALTGTPLLLKHLSQHFQFEYLLTRRLCQDVIENFFGVIRGRHGYNPNPTCLAFGRACKIVLCN